MAVSNPPPSSPSPQPSSLEPHSSPPTSTAVRSYLGPVTSLDNESLDTLRALLRIITDLRHNPENNPPIFYRRRLRNDSTTDASQPPLDEILEEMEDKVLEVFENHRHFPGMSNVEQQFWEFKNALNPRFKGEKTKHPCWGTKTEIIYVAGILKGGVELVLEQQAYWKARLIGEKPTRLAHRPNFDRSATVGDEHQVVNEVALAATHSLQGDLPSTDHSFNGMLRICHTIIHIICKGYAYITHRYVTHSLSTTSLFWE